MTSQNWEDTTNETFSAGLEFKIFGVPLVLDFDLICLPSSNLIIRYFRNFWHDYYDCGFIQ